jgi:hypothetical protein
MTEVYRDQVVQVGTSGSYGNGTVRDVAILTTSGSTVTAIYATPVIAVGQACIIKAKVLGRKDDATAAAGIEKIATFRRQSAGNVTLVGAVQGTTQTDGVTPAITISANTTNQTAEVTVAGIAAQTWVWECSVEFEIH